MEIEKTQTESIGVLTLKGRLDTTTAPQLHEALTEIMSSAEKVELDFAGIEYVSSAGLRVLLLGQKSSKASGKSLALRNVSSDVLEVFDITGFSGVLTVI